MAEQQVYFEDVEVGREIPALVQHCDSQRLVMWAAGSGDFYQIHYDKDFALGNNLPDRIVHGALKHALLGRMLHDWVKYDGSIRSYGCSYRGMDMVNRAVICRGVVTKKHQEGNEGFIELDIWTEDEEGRQTSPGSAVVVLPSRSGS